MANTNRDQINSAMGGSQDPNQDDYQQSMGGGQYGGGAPTPTPTPTPTTLTMAGAPAAASVGDSGTFTPTIAGGTPPYTLSLLSGTLPPDRTVNGAANTVTGTYTTAGTYNYTLRATDSGTPAQTADLPVTATIAATPTTATFGSTSATWGDPALTFGMTS